MKHFDIEIYDNLKKFSVKNNIILIEDDYFFDIILNRLVSNKKKYGEYYCPCKPGYKEENICPCNECLILINKNGRCHCGILKKKG